MKRIRRCAITLVIACLPACRVEDSHHQPNTDGGAGTSQTSQAGRGGERAARPPVIHFGSDGQPPVIHVEDDAGVDRCELPSEPAHSAARAYCEGCGAASDATCCIVQGLCCVDGFSELAPLAFDACESGASTCELPATAFGPAPALYDAGSWVPAPSSSLRSGLVMNGSVDAQQRVRFGARLSRSDAVACARCSELVGVGLAREPVLDTSRTLTPELSVVVSSELSSIILAAGSNTLWSMAIDANPHDIALERDPDGLVRLSIDGLVQVALLVPLPKGPLSAMIFGRSDPNLDRTRSARIGAAFAGSTRCESSRTWDGAAEEISLADLDARDLTELRSPSVIALDGARWLAYESTGVIRAVRLADPASRLELRPPGGFAERLTDPEWALEGDGLALYYTAVGSDGLRNLGRAHFNGAVPDAAVEHAQWLTAREVGARELFGPSFAIGPDGTRLLLATALDADGTYRLVLLRDAADGAPEPRFEPQTARTLLAVERRAVGSEFDALGSADLSYRRGQYQVYFAASSAAVWAISLLVSVDLNNWLSAGRVIDGLDESRPGDAGARDPDCLVEGDTFSVYFAGKTAPDATTQLASAWPLARVSRTGRAICGGSECGAELDCAADSRATVRCER